MSGKKGLDRSTLVIINGQEKLMDFDRVMVGSIRDIMFHTIPLPERYNIAFMYKTKDGLEKYVPCTRDKRDEIELYEGMEFYLPISCIPYFEGPLTVQIHIKINGQEHIYHKMTATYKEIFDIMFPNETLDVVPYKKIIYTKRESRTIKEKLQNGMQILMEPGMEFYHPKKQNTN